MLRSPVMPHFFPVIHEDMWRSRLVPLPCLAPSQAGRLAAPGERPAGRRGGDTQQPGPTGGGRRAASRLAWLAVDGGRQTPVCGMLRERGGQRRVVVWLPRGYLRVATNGWQAVAERRRAAMRAAAAGAGDWRLWRRCAWLAAVVTIICLSAESTIANSTLRHKESRVAPRSFTF